MLFLKISLCVTLATLFYHLEHVSSAESVLLIQLPAFDIEGSSTRNNFLSSLEETNNCIATLRLQI